MSMSIQQLEAARDAARAAAEKNPLMQESVKITGAIVELKLVRKKAKGQLSADQAKQLSALEAQRDELHDKLFESVTLAQAALTKARRHARAEADKNRADTFAVQAVDRSKTNGTSVVEELEAERDRIFAQRKELKRQQRAVAIALASKQIVARAQELVSQLSAADRKALLEDSAGS